MSSVVDTEDKKILDQTMIYDLEFISPSNNLTNPEHAFQYDPLPPRYNESFNPGKQNKVKILAVDDSFHDFAKGRDGYISDSFNEYISNYLMTGTLFEGDYVTEYKNNINFPEFSGDLTLSAISIQSSSVLSSSSNATTAPLTASTASTSSEPLPSSSNSISFRSDRFEPKVAQVYEEKFNLQPAVVTITFDEILNALFLKKQPAKENLEKKLVESNGSVELEVPEVYMPDGLPKKSVNDYFSIRFKTEKNIADAKKTLSKFIRFYMFSKNLNLDQFDIFNEKIYVLFDAGQALLGNISDVAGSGVSNYIGCASIMDSANNSTNPLDPSIKNLYETLPTYQEETPIQAPEQPKSSSIISMLPFSLGTSTSSKPTAKKGKNSGRVRDTISQGKGSKDIGLVVPIVSNYFTMDKIFMGYMQNPGESFSNNIYAFSLVILNIERCITEFQGELTKEDFNKLRTLDRSEEEYQSSIKKISVFINKNPDLVARYTFGDRPTEFITIKGTKRSPEYNIKYNVPCGISGAGVSYLGHMFNALLDLIKRKTQTPTDFRNIISNKLNEVVDKRKTSRISIADSRILQLVKPDATSEELKEFLHLLLLFITDYKRTGDYQQVYTVLKSIQTNHKYYIDNKPYSKKMVFSTGDELACLLARMCRLPSMYQISTSGKMFLYRSEYFYYNDQERRVIEIQKKFNTLKNNVNITFNDTKVTYKELETKYNEIISFIIANYDNMCSIRDKIYKVYGDMKQLQIKDFQLLELIYYIEYFNELIRLCNAYFQSGITDNIITFKKNLIQFKNDCDKLIQQIIIKKNVENVENVENVIKSLQEEINKITQEKDEIRKNNFSNIMEYVAKNRSLDLTNNSVLLSFTSDNSGNFKLQLTNTENNNERPKILFEYIKYVNKTNTDVKSIDNFLDKVQEEKKRSNQQTTNTRPKRESRGYSPNINTESSGIIEKYKNYCKRLGFEGTNKNGQYNDEIETDCAKKIDAFEKYYSDSNISKCDAESVKKLVKEKEELLVPIPMEQMRGGDGEGEGDIQDNSITPQAINKTYISQTFLQIFLKLLNRCYNYMMDISYGFTELNPETISDLNSDYDTRLFCYRLLYGDDSMEGVLVELLNVIQSNSYTVSDFVESEPGNKNPIGLIQLLEIMKFDTIIQSLVLLSYFGMKEIDTTNDSDSINLSQLTSSSGDSSDDSSDDSSLSTNENAKALLEAHRIGSDEKVVSEGNRDSEGKSDSRISDSDIESISENSEINQIPENEDELVLLEEEEIQDDETELMTEIYKENKIPADYDKNISELIQYREEEKNNIIDQQLFKDNKKGLLSIVILAWIYSVYYELKGKSKTKVEIDNHESEEQVNDYTFFQDSFNLLNTKTLVSDEINKNEIFYDLLPSDFLANKLPVLFKTIQFFIESQMKPTEGGMKRRKTRILKKKTLVKRTTIKKKKQNGKRRSLKKKIVGKKPRRTIKKR